MRKPAKELAELIDEALSKGGWTRDELARAADINRVQLWRLRQRSPKRATLSAARLRSAIAKGRLGGLQEALERATLRIVKGRPDRARALLLMLRLLDEWSSDIPPKDSRAPMKKNATQRR